MARTTPASACTHCGEKNEPPAQTCRKCGQPFEDLSDDYLSSQPPERFAHDASATTKESRKILWRRLGMIVAVIVAVVAGGIAYTATRPPATASSAVPSNLLAASQMLSLVEHQQRLYTSESTTMAVTLPNVAGAPMTITCQKAQGPGVGHWQQGFIEAGSPDHQSAVSACIWRYGNHLDGWNAYKVLRDGLSGAHLSAPAVVLGDERYLSHAGGSFNGIQGSNYTLLLRHSEVVARLEVQSPHPNLSDFRALSNWFERRIARTTK